MQTYNIVTNNNQHHITQLLSDCFGSRTMGKALKQLLFWAPKAKRTDGLLYKSAREMAQETGLSPYQLDRAMRNLRELDLIDWSVKRANGSPTRHYWVKYQNLRNFLLNADLAVLLNGFGKIANFITELISNNIKRHIKDNVVVEKIKKLRSKHVDHGERSKPKPSPVEKRVKTRNQQPINTKSTFDELTDRSWAEGLLG